MRTSDGRKGRRRAHAAASSRIFTAGVSSAAAFGMVAGMALATGAGSDGGPGEVALVPADAAPAAPATTPVPGPREMVVIRRHWIQVPSGPATPAASPPSPAVTSATATPATASAPASPARTPQPAPRRPVTHSRGS